MHHIDPERTFRLFAEMNEATLRNRAAGIETIAAPCPDVYDITPAMLNDERVASTYDEQLGALDDCKRREEAA